MNYYIDFDNTMYNTAKLTKRMLETIANEISKKGNLDKKQISLECKSLFNKENIYNIYSLTDFLSNKYGIEATPILDKLNHTILNCSDLIYSDVIPFLKNLDEKKHKKYILTYEGNTLKYQLTKIAGSNIDNYFDGIYLTSGPKYELDIDYSNGIFIDDNPKDLLGLYSKNPKEVIRIRRKENKYSVQDIKNCNIKEYTDFNEITLI